MTLLLSFHAQEGKSMKFLQSIQILQSKKFQAAIVGLIVAILGKAGFDVDDSTIMAIISPILAYIGGQAVADIGKEKAIVEVKAEEEAQATERSLG
jgi:hypothetical protein